MPLINENNISSTIRGLSKGKAYGSDLINNEQLIYSGRHLRKLLPILFTLHIESYIPIKMKVGVIIIIFKGGSKSRDDPNSYRAITPTSSVLKLYERILYSRLRNTLENPLNSLQGGFQKNMG